MSPRGALSPVGRETLHDRVYAERGRAFDKQLAAIVDDAKQASE